MYIFLFLQNVLSCSFPYAESDFYCQVAKITIAAQKQSILLLHYSKFSEAKK